MEYGTTHLARQQVKLGNILKPALEKDKVYCIVDPGLNEWNGGYKYLGFWEDGHTFEDVLEPLRPGNPSRQRFHFTSEQMEQMIKQGQIAEEAQG